VKVWLILHAALAVATVGLSVHNGLLSLSHWRGNYRKPLLQKFYVRWLAILFGLNMALGLVIYPAFRVGVRAAWLDAEVPLASGFFEAKEHWLALGMLLLAWYYPKSRDIVAGDRSPEARLYCFAGVALSLIVVFSALTGFALVALKSI